MTSLQSSGQVLKIDTLARVRTSRERRQELLAEFERSGLSGSKFAALVGVKYSTFAAWAARRKRSQPVATATAKVVDGAAKVRWLEAVIDRAQSADGTSPSTLTVQFAGGARAEIANLQQAEVAAALLRALDKASARC
jgi:DNA-binding transcriptional regulator YiaG